MKTAKNDLVTKEYLDKTLDARFTQFKAEFKDELYTIKDEIVGEIKDMREEFEAHQYSHTRIDDTLDDHEKRLTTLEPQH